MYSLYNTGLHNIMKDLSPLRTSHIEHTVYTKKILLHLKKKKKCSKFKGATCPCICMTKINKLTPLIRAKMIKSINEPH